MRDSDALARFAERTSMALIDGPDDVLTRQTQRIVLALVEVAKAAQKLERISNFSYYTANDDLQSALAALSTALKEQDKHG